MRDTHEILSTLQEIGVAEEEYDARFTPERAKYPKSSPKPLSSPKWDLENCVRYAQNFVALLGNRGQGARI